MRKALTDTSRATQAAGPDPVDVYVGARLRLRRNVVGMSQEHLGKALGLTFQQIQKYERGTNRMGASRLYQMAELLSVPVAWFFDDFTPHHRPAAGFAEGKQAQLADAPAPEAGVLQQRETLDLVRAYYRITDPKQRRKVLELIRSMAEDEA